MPDGRELWGGVESLRPTILTGLPMGNWAEPQKVYSQVFVQGLNSGVQYAGAEQEVGSSRCLPGGWFLVRGNGGAPVLPAGRLP